MKSLENCKRKRWGVLQLKQAAISSRLKAAGRIEVAAEGDDKEQTALKPKQEKNKPSLPCLW